MSKPRIMVVDDEDISRELIEMYIKSSGRYELAGSVSLAEYAFAYSITQKIDLVVMDIYMRNGSNGLAAAERIKRNNPAIKIIAATSLPDSVLLKKAKEIGVDSFWYKEAGNTGILDVIDRTLRGESVYPDNPPAVSLGMADASSFTEKELEILRYLTTGAPNSVIAERLGMSEGTIKQYLNRILSKTGCDNRTELAVKARLAGIAVYLNENEETK